MEAKRTLSKCVSVVIPIQICPFTILMERSHYKLINYDSNMLEIIIKQMRVPT